MSDAKSVPTVPSKKAIVVLAVIAFIASAGGIFSVAQLTLQSKAWDQDKAALAEKARALQAALDQLEATAGESTQARSQLIALTENVSRQEKRLDDLARRMIGAQASLERKIKARQELEREAQEVRLQLDHAQSSLAPLRLEIATRGQEIQDLEAVLRKARDQLDQTISHLEALRPKPTN